ncbi:MAG: CDP-alcohol phosphatidyltransferase family protein [Bacteroides sp.]|nr:CDP-alcohol phosphatidyltransferase family protein [Bacteroides sp.]
MLAGHFLTRDIGRICSAFFIRHGVIPNVITVYMILFGIAGSVLFALPNVWCKFIGYFCWIMWFSMDCSDGQVARYTRHFSKYGAEMDFMAHLIDHPCMIMSIWLTFLQMKVMEPIPLSAIFLAVMAMEMIMRNITAFNHYHSKMDSGKSAGSGPAHISSLRYVWRQVYLFPNFIVCFSWFIPLGYLLDAKWTIWVFLGWACLFVLGFIRGLFTVFSRIYPE